MAKGIIEKIVREIYGSEGVDIAKSIDIIGDIAIIKSQDEAPIVKRLGEALLSNLKYIKVVLRQSSPVEGEYRLRRLEYVAGEDRRVTIHKEYGVKIKLDVENIYFTPRLSTERNRIANMVRDGEEVINMFAGAGPYTILMAKRRRIHVHSIDINPIAIDYHLENIYMNKVEDRVTLYRGDAGDMIEKHITSVADRVLMPLPEKALEYIKYALQGLKDSGWIHIYLHLPFRNSIRETLNKAVSLFLDNISGRAEVLGINARKVREVGPRLIQVCIDTYILKV